MALTFVSSTLTLAGYTVATFGSAQAAQFKQAVATAAGVQPASVTITAVSAATLQRHLLAVGSVSVSYSVQVATAAASAASAALAGGTLAVASFTAAGLVSCTGLAVTSAPASGAATPVPLPSLPVTTAEQAPQAAGARPASAAGVALAALLLAV